MLLCCVVVWCVDVSCAVCGFTAPSPAHTTHTHRGTLADALLRQRRYHTSAPPAHAAVDLPALLELLLAAAHALRHLHALGLSHGDVKLDNVLLRSDATAPLGYSAKLADFGLARLLCGERDVINLFGAGVCWRRLWGRGDG